MGWLFWLSLAGIAALIALNLYVRRLNEDDRKHSRFHLRGGM